MMKGMKKTWNRGEKEAIAEVTEELLRKIATQLDSRGIPLKGPGDMGIVSGDAVRSIAGNKRLKKAQEEKPLAVLLSIIAWVGSFLQQ